MINHLISGHFSHSGKMCYYVRENETNTNQIESDLLGCVTYMHRRKLLGPPRMDNFKAVLVKEVMKNNGTGFTVAGLFKFLFSFLFVGLCVGALAIVVLVWRGSQLSYERMGLGRNSMNDDLNMDSFVEDSRL